MMWIDAGDASNGEIGHVAYLLWPRLGVGTIEGDFSGPETLASASANVHGLISSEPSAFAFSTYWGTASGVFPQTSGAELHRSGSRL